VAHLLASTGGLENMKKINNSTMIHNIFYDNFEGGIYRLTDGQISPNGKWKAIYTGYGSMGVASSTNPTTSTKNNYFFEEPKTSVYHNQTRGSLVTTTKAFSDFKMTLKMKTVKQIRENSPPNPWETGWVFWHYMDRFHYYALVLKTDGFQIEKKDNNVRCDCEIYLVDVSHPKVKLGQWQTVTLRVTNSASGTPHIKVWVNGVKAADFVDNKIRQPNSPELASGDVGLYNEDALVNFDNVNINAIK
jgi:hypothetical protein